MQQLLKTFVENFFQVMSPARPTATSASSRWWTAATRSAGATRGASRNARWTARGWSTGWRSCREWRTLTGGATNIIQTIFVLCTVEKTYVYSASFDLKAAHGKLKVKNVAGHNGSLRLESLLEESPET